MNKEFAKIWQSWLDSIEQLPTEEEKGELALAIFRYSLRKQEYKGNNVFVKITMPIIQKTIDISEQNSLNGQKGGQKSVESRNAQSTATSTASSDGSTAASNTKTIDNRHKTIDNKTKDNRQDYIYIFRQNLINKGCSEELADEYISMRKKKKVAISKIVYDKLEREIESNNLCFPEVIEECVMRGWQGFKAEWIKPKTTQPTIFDGMSEEERAYKEKEERDRQARIKHYMELNKQRDEQGSNN